MADNNYTVSDPRPLAAPDQTAGINGRRSKYGESFTQNVQTERNAIAGEGSYYTVVNPTIDTTVGYGAIAAYAATTPAFLVSNSSQKRTIYLDCLKLLVTVAPASATNWKYLVDVDSSLRLSTSPTGGVARQVNNANPAAPNDFEGTVWAFTGGTVLTVMGGSNLRTIAHGRWAESIPIVLDEMVLQFGQGETGGNSVATVGRRFAAAPPVAIPPGCSAAIHMYGTSNAITGMSAEYYLGMWQR